ncbi:hypothetical protein GPX89_13295 [Nocardia sp. ET3-3]|uniref:Uncharacterized protein n=1 Tax=Nocardia terrae TaxID=2675851 RepID=A0A7K1UV16_9NOCA|nr:hypothetical protein [Nocardia terrae]MVU78216.1 hypothetical protein [Nocardia terrae]
MSELWEWSKPARTYEVRPDGRAQLRVFLSVGDQAQAVTPWHSHKNPMLLSVAEIARDCDLPEIEVVGREYTAAGDENGLREFQLVHDPRL